MTQQEQPTQTKWYEVYDTQTGYTAGGPYSSRKSARKMADRLYLGYGAVKYGVREQQ